MLRPACLAVAVVTGSLSGCSLVLDFSDGAIPVDAAPDAPYTQAQCDYLEPNNAFGEAAMITPAEMGTAAICAGDVEDRDFYRFTVPDATPEVRVGILFTQRPTGDLDLRLLDGTGTVIASSFGFVDNETIVCPGASPLCPALAAGDYVFEVYPATPGATNVYQLALTISPM